VSNKDNVFINKFWHQLFNAQGKKLALCLAYHPQMNDQSEVLNQTLEMYLRCLCYDNPKLWLSMLTYSNNGTTLHIIVPSR